jgi:putative DNA primase/helicase
MVRARHRASWRRRSLTARTDIDWAVLCEPVARIVWGEPMGETSKELRWGTHGARCLDRERGVWFDFEANCGGGAFDLVPGSTSREKMEWLRAHHLIGWSHA